MAMDAASLAAYAASSHERAVPRLVDLRLQYPLLPPWSRALQLGDLFFQSKSRLVNPISHLKSVLPAAAIS